MIRKSLSSMNIKGAMPSVLTGAAAMSSSSSFVEKDKEGVWEMRPGGMLVQKRSDSEGHTPKCILVRVAYGTSRYEIIVSSQATFGELKKLLTAECGLQHWEQRITYKGKERQDKQFLDICGVKDRSKLILNEDPCSREKRFLEMRKNSLIERTQRAVSEVASQVDCLEEQVSGIEKSIGNDIKVAEVRITALTELLMRQAVKLENILAEGEVSALKNLQAKRVQKCVEILDGLKVSNATLKPVIVSTKWETFDPPPNTTQFWNLLD